MKIKLSTRFTKNETQEEKEERIQNEILGINTSTKKIVEYEYSTMVQDTNNIVGFNYYDKYHTALRTQLGEVFIIKGHVDNFISLWETITGEEVINMLKV